MERTETAAFVLHTESSGEQGLGLDLISPTLGRIKVWSPHGRSRRSQVKAMAQLFSPLLITFKLEGGQRILCGCAASGMPFTFNPPFLFTALYLNELTALFDNLLENAYEAAKSSEHHYINVSVDKKNEQYIIFYIVNSCDVSPNINGKSFITSKKDKSYHGFGLKSINKIAKKYQGNAEFRYDEMSKSFISSVLLKATDNN